MVAVRATYRTDVIQRYGEEADREIQRIIAQNRSGTGSPEPVAEHRQVQQGNKVRPQPLAHRAGQPASEASGA